jgi:subtilisin family serine protease
VDGSVEPAAVRGARVTQQAFGPGGSKVSAHATAVASLMAGEDAGFRGAAPGATIYVADVYGPTAAGGSATAIARGLGWLAEQRTPVINVSLVGPPNALLAAAVQGLVRRGHVVVAAVGNDGPAAPPLYPAAYPDVLGVTGLDSRRRVLPEAARGPQVDFAAPGAGLAAAGPKAGYVAVRGTSYAAPLVAGLAAQLTPEPSPGAAARTIAELTRRAADLGASGPDPVFGRGALALDLAKPPSALAKARR